MKKKPICNACGRVLNAQLPDICEDMLTVQKEWGYFSRKDLCVHSFCLCESCYDRITAQFVIPVACEIKTEV